jgi:hypothetical protein
MNKYSLLIPIFCFSLSCSIFKAKKQIVLKSEAYCFEEFDSAKFLLIYGPNPKYGTSDDWGIMTENGEMVGGDCIHRADSILICNKYYGANKKCDTIARPGYQKKINKK